MQKRKFSAAGRRSSLPSNSALRMKCVRTEAAEREKFVPAVSSTVKLRLSRCFPPSLLLSLSPPFTAWLLSQSHPPTSPPQKHHHPLAHLASPFPSPRCLGLLAASQGLGCDGGSAPTG